MIAKRLLRQHVNAGEVVSVVGSCNIFYLPYICGMFYLQFNFKLL